MEGGIVESPAGDLFIQVDSEGRLVQLLTGVALGDHHAAVSNGAPSGGLKQVTRQVEEYFEGRRVTFELEMAPVGTPFQHKVWAALQRIPFGETRTYGELALQVGVPGSARAIGRANATNPISIIVPCHRVIGASGALTGYAGGLDVKRFLLDFESRAKAPTLF